MFARVVTSLVRGNRFNARLLCSVTHVQRSFIRQVEKHGEDGMLVVEWKDKSVSRFPYVYLRDLCTCSKCMNSDSLERLSDVVAEVPLDIKAKNVTVSSLNGEKIHILWPDHHVSEFESKWLYSKKLLEKDEREEYFTSPNIARKGVKFWDKSAMQDKIPRFDYNRIIHDDQSLFEWLHTLHSVGIALLDNAPTYTNPTACENICKRVGYLKSTHYGNFFDVIVKNDANNIAFTAIGLPLHCDLAYLEYYPGLQFLHCLKQTETEGGTNYFADGFHVAQEIKDNAPELFDLLCETPLPYFDVGKDDFIGDFHLKAWQPVFEFDHDRKINRITFNNPVRDCYTNGTAEKVKLLYKAYTKVGLAMREPKNNVYYKMKPGEMVTMNNSRVLHGRTGFTATESTNRHLQGCYLDWDLVYARLRALGNSPQDENLRLRMQYIY